MIGILDKITLAKYSNNERKLKQFEKTVRERREERERKDQELWEKYRSKQSTSDATEDHMDIFLTEMEEDRREIVSEDNAKGGEQTKVLTQNNHIMM